MSERSGIRASEGSVDGSRVSFSFAIGALVLLVTSLACLAIAPFLMPDSYSVIANTTSESAAQGVEGASLARLGFLFLGFAVLVLAGPAGLRWRFWSRLAFRLYGVAMIATAAFSHMPWENVPYDSIEDTLHSVAASTVGAAFTIGVALVAVHRGPGQRQARIFDVTAVTAALVIPMLMFNIEGIAGLVQRIMFVVAYIWFGLEAIRAMRDG